MPAAFASNSWYLGDNGQDAVSVYEMPNKTEVTLIYGMHFLRGIVPEAGRTILKESGGDPANH